MVEIMTSPHPVYFLFFETFESLGLCPGFKKNNNHFLKRQKGGYFSMVVLYRKQKKTKWYLKVEHQQWKKLG